MDASTSSISNMNSSNLNEPPSIGDCELMYYDMSGKKYLVILNHHTFQKTIYFRYQKPKNRESTKKDVESLQRVFGSLGFEVIVYDDLEYYEIIKNLTAFATKDHTETSCVCVTILTHGDKDGSVFAADRPYLLTDIMCKFEKQLSLVNKPKLFIVQACRGTKIDAGQPVLDGESNCTLTVPSHADFLVLYSTVKDYLSYKNAGGSWMIQALCHIIDKYHEDLDLLHMITLMNRKVAYEKATYIPSSKPMDNKKQMPEAKFTLTKLLKF